MKILRTTLAACAIATSVAMVSGTTAPPVHAGTAVGVNGFRGGTVGNTLQGWVWEGSTTQRDLDYSDTPFWMDSSIANGVAALVALMGQTPDVDRLIGKSQSALVIIAALREHPEIVPEGGLTVYLIANPGRARTGGSVRYEGAFVPILGLTNKGAIRQDIPGLTVIDVAYEYDLIVDSPNPFNLLAVLNAVVGGLMLHAAYDDVDMTDPNLWVRQVGNTTQYLVPAKRLPLLLALYNFGLGALADAIAPGLRALINAGHDREGYVRQGTLAQSRIADIAGASRISSAAFSGGDADAEGQTTPSSDPPVDDDGQLPGGGNDALGSPPIESPGPESVEPLGEVVPGGAELEGTDGPGDGLTDGPDGDTGLTTPGDTPGTSAPTRHNGSPKSSRGTSAAGSPGSRPSRPTDQRRGRHAAAVN